MSKLYLKLVSMMVLYLCSSVIQAHDPDDQFVVTYYAHPQMPALLQVIEKSYADIGIKTEFRLVPLKRGLVMVQDGQADADVVRNAAILDQFPDVIEVIHLVDGEMMLICQAELVCNESVLGDPTAYISANSAGIADVKLRYGDRLKASLIELPSFEAMLGMIDKKRAPYALFVRVRGKSLESIKDKYNHVVIYRAKGVHVINKKHKHLLAPLRKAITNNLQTMLDPSQL